MDSSYRSNISINSSDQDWDDFLIHVPGNHYTQSSLWAKVNETLGWQAIRITILKDKRIVAGAQMMIKKSSSVTIIGYVIKGPVLSMNEPELIESLFSELSVKAKQNQICFVAIQPPDNTTWLNQLSEFGFPSQRHKNGTNCYNFNRSETGSGLSLVTDESPDTI